jgi:hypothetical protein
MIGLQIDKHAQIRATRLKNIKCTEKCSGSPDLEEDEGNVRVVGGTRGDLGCWI